MMRRDYEVLIEEYSDYQVVVQVLTKKDSIPSGLRLSNTNPIVNSSPNTTKGTTLRNLQLPVITLTGAEEVSPNIVFKLRASTLLDDPVSVEAERVVISNGTIRLKFPVLDIDAKSATIELVAVNSAKSASRVLNTWYVMEKATHDQLSNTNWLELYKSIRDSDD